MTQIARYLKRLQIAFKSKSSYFMSKFVFAIANDQEQADKLQKKAILTTIAERNGLNALIEADVLSRDKKDWVKRYYY